MYIIHSHRCYLDSSFILAHFCRQNFRVLNKTKNEQTTDHTHPFISMTFIIFLVY